jgi:shikimate kinase
MAPKLILTGFMATGKSVVAGMLARQLGWNLVDCDAEIVRRAGKSIEQIFRDHGEADFRQLERLIISEIAAEPRRCAHCGEPRPAVVATGGGAIVDPDNYAALRRTGIIICLAARPEVVARRIGPAASTRPMLTRAGGPLTERVAHLMAARRQAYERAAATIDTSDLEIENVANLVLEAFAAYGSRQWWASA